MSGPRVVLDAPARWKPAEIPPPKISESAGAELTQFVSLRSDDAGAITFGCVATAIPGWVDDMRPAVEGRTVALAGASAALANGNPVDARDDHHGGFELRVASDLGGPVIGRARTFIGFDPSHVHTCFATCVRSTTCEHAIETARLEGSLPPPSPGLALSAVTWSVHHPHPFALGTAVAIALVAILSVALRRKPRHR